MPYMFRPMFDAASGLISEAMEQRQRTVDDTFVPVHSRLAGMLYLGIYRDSYTYGYEVQDYTGRRIHSWYMHGGDTFTNFENSILNGLNNLSPARGSEDYRLLQNHAFTWNTEEEIEEDMPNTTQPDKYSFVIAEDTSSATGGYKILPPSCGLVPYSQDWEETLEEAYAKAFDFSNHCNINYRNLEARYRVWPRRNSNAYKELLKRGQIANPTSITGFSDFRKLINTILAKPEDDATPLLIVHAAEYLTWRKLGRVLINSYYTSAILKLANIIKVKTNVEYIRVHSDPVNMYLKSKALKVYTGPVEDEGFIYTLTMKDAYKCPDCKFIFHKHYKIHLNDGTLICRGCLSGRGLYRCDDCEEVHNYNDGCPRFRMKPLEHIFGYSTNVRRYIPRMFSIKKGLIAEAAKEEIKYGVELEVLKRSNFDLHDAVAKVAAATRKYAIIKSDSSLGSDGFEIVTAPATLDFHRKKLWEDFFKLKSPRGLVPAEYVQAWNTGVCGTHIHISRNALTKMQLAKLLVFYHEDSNLAFLSKIAGRAVGPGAHYCKTRKKKLGISTDRECHNHHEAITISERNNGETAEVRIFRGNATKHGVMRSLEFVDATVKWCGIVAASKLNYLSFLRWFDSPDIRSNYPDLWRHLMQLGYIKTPHVSKGKKLMDLIPEKERVA